jgi:hypothetical protein
VISLPILIVCGYTVERFALIEVETIEIHHFVPGRHEVVYEFFVRVVAGVDFGDGTKLRVGTEHEVDGSGRPFDLVRFAVPPFVEVLAVRRLPPFRSHVEQIDEEVIGQCSGAFREDAQRRVIRVGAQNPQAANEDSHFGSGERQQMGSIQEKFGAGPVKFVIMGVVVAEAVGFRFQWLEGLRIGHLVGGIGAARRERDLDVVPGLLSGLLDGSAPAQNNQVRSKGSGPFVFARQRVQRGRPLRDEELLESTARRLDFESTMRPLGRQSVRPLPGKQIKEA